MLMGARWVCVCVWKGGGGGGGEKLAKCFSLSKLDMFHIFYYYIFLVSTFTICRDLFS